MPCRGVIYPVFSIEKAFRNSHRRITGSSHSVCGRMKKAKRVVEGTRRDGICSKIMIKFLLSSYVGLVANCLILYLNDTRVPKWHIPPQDHILRERQSCTLERQCGAGAGETKPLALSLAAFAMQKSPAPESHPCPRLMVTARALSMLLRLVFSQMDYTHPC